MSNEMGTRAFNGKSFYYAMTLPFLELAREYAQQVRKEGFLARVVRQTFPWQDDCEFAVYTHPKLPHRKRIEELRAIEGEKPIIAERAKEREKPTKHERG